MVVAKVLTVAVDKEVEETPSPQVTPVKEENKEPVLQCLSPLAQPALNNESSSERVQLPVTIHSIIAETTNDVRTTNSPCNSEHRGVASFLDLYFFVLTTRNMWDPWDT